MVAAVRRVDDLNPVVAVVEDQEVGHADPLERLDANTPETRAHFLYRPVLVHQLKDAVHPHRFEAPALGVFFNFKLRGHRDEVP